MITQRAIFEYKRFWTASKFHEGNVVLIGDVAHLALPFTSAGTTNAILDAKALTEVLLKIGNSELALSNIMPLAKMRFPNISIWERVKRALYAP
jgi:2-polyprenyl-6-methoxyphenol hydroxylase-like FAD-dependent oxidoreductase